MDSEEQLIRKIMRSVPSEVGCKPSSYSHIHAHLGIGDDAAVVVPGKNKNLVLSCDAFMEGVHFLSNIHPPYSAGFKSLARATSDLAAMGAVPKFFLLTLALPSSRTGSWLANFLQGMGRAARELGMRLIGGDTTRFSKVSVSITVVGEIAPGRGVTRVGARPGDTIYVSGKLGRAQLGLAIATNRPDLASKDRLKSTFLPLQQHLYPRIRVGLGSWLAQHRIASAMIDISDGLSTDLNRLCAASRVGARLWASRIPCVEISPEATRLIQQRKSDPLDMALNGGDDYELLFTVPHDAVKRLRGAPQFREMTAIGEIERGNRVMLVEADGGAKRLVRGGWDPFGGK
jgi:thiamine-monophosphate kinase